MAQTVLGLRRHLRKGRFGDGSIGQFGMEQTVVSEASFSPLHQAHLAMALAMDGQKTSGGWLQEGDGADEGRVETIVRSAFARQISDQLRAVGCIARSGTGQFRVAGGNHAWSTSQGIHRQAGIVGGQGIR